MSSPPRGYRVLLFLYELGFYSVFFICSTVRIYLLQEGGLLICPFFGNIFSGSVSCLPFIHSPPHQSSNNSLSFSCNEKCSTIDTADLSFTRQGCASAPFLATFSLIQCHVLLHLSCLTSRPRIYQQLSFFLSFLCNENALE
jgi:hypothetical protein